MNKVHLLVLRQVESLEVSDDINNASDMHDIITFLHPWCEYMLLGTRVVIFLFYNNIRRVDGLYGVIVKRTL